MRIIGKTQDYYDGAGQFSSEPVWVRKEQKTTTKKLGEYGIDNQTIHKLETMCGRVPRPDDDLPFVIVVFCGKPHIVWYKSQYLGRPQDIISAASPSSMVEKWNKVRKSTDKEMFLDKGGPSIWLRYRFNDRAMRLWYDEYGNIDFSDVHRAIKSPIFLIDQRYRADDEIIVNPTLKEYGFQCVIPPWEAYTELERFISNDMVDCPLDDFTMSDELKRDSKGMDEWSFKQRGPKARKSKKKS